MSAPVRETVIEGYLLKQSREHGFLCMKFTSPARDGVPDRIIVTPGGTVFVEVKRPGETLEKLQRATHIKMRRFGAVIHVVDDRPSVDALIHELIELAHPHALHVQQRGA